MSIKSCIAVFCILAVVSASKSNYEVRRFPDKFKFGVATASYQIEGGWNAADKGENIWDRLVHTTDMVIDRSTGDVTCNSYNFHKKDIEILSELGVDFYRFSLSWSRLLPNGFANKVSQDGLRYYNQLINDLLAANIEPIVTIYHWDLPQPLQNLGGWVNPMIVDYFEDYAKIVFESFGDRVKTWLTFNEPAPVCGGGYGGVTKAPALDMYGTADYICGHNLLKSHARVYHLYNNVFKPTQGGRVGLTIDSRWAEPGSSSSGDLQAQNIYMQFNLGWYAHPIYSREGDYPQLVKERIAANSQKQGYPRSRLPEFTEEEINYIRGTYDFFGLNHYTTTLVTSSPPDVDYDMTVLFYPDPSWQQSASYWLYVVPWGFTKLLNWIKDEYYNPEVIIFENGFSDNNDMHNDDNRVKYYNDYLNAMLDAIENGCNVTGYTSWSLMDNFEWLEGYTEKFGLYHVDFNNPNRPRTPKKSAVYYKDLIASRSIERNLKNDE